MMPSIISRQLNDTFLCTKGPHLPPIVQPELWTLPTLLTVLNILSVWYIDEEMMLTHCSCCRVLNVLTCIPVVPYPRWPSLACPYCSSSCVHVLIIINIILHLNANSTLHHSHLIFFLHTQLLLIECPNIQFIQHLKSSQSPCP